MEVIALTLADRRCVVAVNSSPERATKGPILVSSKYRRQTTYGHPKEPAAVESECRRENETESWWREHTYRPTYHWRTDRIASVVSDGSWSWRL